MRETPRGLPERRTQKRAWIYDQTRRFFRQLRLQHRDKHRAIWHPLPADR